MNRLKQLMGYKHCKLCKGEYKKDWHFFMGPEFCSQKCYDKYIPTMEEENEKRRSIGHPHMLEIVKEKCPKCNGEMWHDQFQKCIDMKKGHMKACYNCTKCKYRILFNLTIKKFDKKPFGVTNSGRKAN